MNIVALIINVIMNFILPSLQEPYQNTAIFRPWTDPIMSLFFLSPFILGIIFAYGWEYTKSLTKERNFWKNGFFIGCIWTVFIIPGMIINFSSFQVSLGMVFSWLVFGFFQYVSGGIVIVRLNKR